MRNHYATASDAATYEYRRLMLDMGTRHSIRPNPCRGTGHGGECYTNAQVFARQNPARWAYIEGLVRRPGFSWEMHGYVLDRAAGYVIEVTPIYTGEAAEYRGWPLNLSMVSELYSTLGEPGPNVPSILWLVMFNAIDDAGRPYQLPRQFRFPRGLVEHSATLR